MQRPNLLWFSVQSYFGLLHAVTGHQAATAPSTDGLSPRLRCPSHRSCHRERLRPALRPGDCRSGAGVRCGRRRLGFALTAASGDSSSEHAHSPGSRPACSGCDTGGLAALPPATTHSSAPTGDATPPRPLHRKQPSAPRGRAPPVFSQKTSTGALKRPAPTPPYRTGGAGVAVGTRMNRISVAKVSLASAGIHISRLFLINNIFEVLT
jgi:hypothetical protein